MQCFKCSIRALLYISLLLFSFVSIYIVNYPEYWGIRYLVAKQSIKNIFNPTTFEEFKPTLKYYSYVKLSRWNNHHIINIIEDAFAFEYEYWCKYTYVDEEGNEAINIDRVIHNWKPWEYHYLEHDKNYITPEHNRAMLLRKEWMDNYRDMEIEKYRRYQID